MDNWDEIRTAYQVARLGTVSAAADIIGVHRATVIRHIDALEEMLGEKLFQRHARGYTPTEAGEDLFRVAQATDEQFSQFTNRTKGRSRDLSGELIVTSLDFLSPYVFPVLAEFQSKYPNVIIRYITGDRLFKLEYGEAHVAIRTGPRPNDPDNVVQPFLSFEMGLYASQKYIDQYGQPIHLNDFTSHRFVGTDNVYTAAPFYIWQNENIPKNNIVFKSTNQSIVTQAILKGIGIGFMNQTDALKNDLVEIMAPRNEWTATSWLVTHVDLHRTTKVQSFLTLLKQGI